MGTFDYFRLLLINVALSARASFRKLTSYIPYRPSTLANEYLIGPKVVTARLFINRLRDGRESPGSRGSERMACHWEKPFFRIRGTTVAPVAFCSRDQLRASTSTSPTPPPQSLYRYFESPRARGRKVIDWWALWSNVAE